MAGLESGFWAENKHKLWELGQRVLTREMTWAEVGRHFGKSGATCRMKFGELKVGPARTLAIPEPVELPPPPPPKAPSPAPKDVHDYLDLPAPPFAVPVVPLGAPAILSGWEQSVTYGDSHVPWEDAAALGAVGLLVEVVQPKRVIHMGDLLDCYTISRFSKDPNRIHTLQDEINLARTHLHQMAQRCPDAERWLLEGNHEDRLRRLIWELPGATAELARLTAFREAMTWPHLLQLDDIGWSFVSTHEQSRKSILPKLITKHGEVVRKWSAWTAKGEYEKYGRGGISGHTHRMGAFFHRDHNGSHVWWEGGCTCRLDQGYCVDPDWQQGALVITHTPDGERFTVEPVYIQDGRAIYRDRDLSA